MVTKKTTKAVAPKKAAVPKKAGAAKKTVARKTGVSEEDIRKKAEEIYYERVARGEHGTPEEDWANAEKFLKAGKKK
jgi:uncharacterized protein YdbL (DUF1318 family)